MELVVGASEATMKSLTAKLGTLLAEEYTLIRGVNGDLQYINDELCTMQSFLRDSATVGGDHRMKDWTKQIRDITYDIEDCIDDSGHRLHGLRRDRCCYFLFNSVYEVLTWWPRRDIASKISILKMRAQQISERRQRYGVDNPQGSRTEGSRAGTPSSTAGFNAADNQQESVQLVTMKDPVGVEKHMGDLKDRVTCIVGFGGVGKTAIATALYSQFGKKFDYRAMVTVSQSSDLESILMSIKSQVMEPTNRQEQQGGLEKNILSAAVKVVGRGTSAVMAKCCSAGISEDKHDSTKLEQIKRDLTKHFEQKSYLVLIDDVWSATTLDGIINGLPRNDHSRIIVTTRFHAVATRRGKESDIRKVQGLGEEKSEKLFMQAFLESGGEYDGTTRSRAPVTTSKGEKGRKTDKFPDEVWKMCGGLPLAIVTMAGHVACNPRKSKEEWLNVCRSLFPESGKELTQEELGRIVAHCYNDMPAEIKTCSLYLSIFPKGHRTSRKRLTRRWIAEGFVCEKHGLSVEDVAEIYFNHLIRRRIIRPVEHSSNGKVKKFIVHDMVLEYIVTKSSEENFITVVGGSWPMQPPSSKVRRLSLQDSDSKHAKDTEKMNLSHVRSLTVFGSLNRQLPSHSFKFGIAQVLDLEGCTGFKQHHTEEICKMLLLRYLSLRGTDIKKLPGTIGKLENLETLDIRETSIVGLPKTVCQLERLVNILGGDKRTQRALKLPEELKKKKKMKALRVLSGIEISRGSEDLHHLTELRKLSIYSLKDIDSWYLGDLISSIEYLGGCSLRTLIIVDESSKLLDWLHEMSTPPKFLVALELAGKMVKLPSWIEHLSDLNKLNLPVTALRIDNLQQLSKLNALFSLTFSFSAGKHGQEKLAILAENQLSSDGEIIVPAHGFKSLKLLRVFAALLPLLIFSENAMPKLERLDLRFSMLEGVFGAENLAGLKEVHLILDDKAGEDMTKQVQREIERAVKRTDGETPSIILRSLVTDRQ